MTAGREEGREVGKEGGGEGGRGREARKGHYVS